MHHPPHSPQEEAPKSALEGMAASSPEPRPGAPESGAAGAASAAEGAAAAEAPAEAQEQPASGAPAPQTGADAAREGSDPSAAGVASEEGGLGLSGGGAASSSALGTPVVSIGDHRRIWHASHQKHPDETDATPSWYHHKRHILVFTYSGKPVYTRYGSDDSISGTTGALSAIVSKFAKFFFGSQHDDTLRYLVAGDHLFVFLEKGPLWLVCVSKCGDTYHDLQRLLERVYLQVITILTTGIEKTLQVKPNYDVRSLLGGTECVVNNIVRWCTQDLHLQVEGYEPLPIPPQVRSIATEALRSARVAHVLVGFLLAGHRMLAMATNRQYRPHPADLLALINLILSSASLRTAESWIPVCMVHLNDKAFAYAYISFVEASDVGVVFLSTTSDGEQFYAIAQQAAIIKQTLKSSGCLAAVADAMQNCPVDLRAAAHEDRSGTEKSGRRDAAPPLNIGHARLMEGIIHAAYFVPASGQFFSSAIAPPYRSRRRTKMLFRSYGRCRYLLRTAKLPSQICVATDHECFFVSVAAEFHIYMTVPRGISTTVIQQFYQWIKSQEAYLFLGTIPTW